MDTIEHEGFIELIVNFDEFIDFLRPENKNKLHPYIGSKSNRLIYRGQPDSRHSLVPSLFRDTFEYSSFSKNYTDLCFAQFCYLKSFIHACDLNAVPIPNDSYDLREKSLKNFDDSMIFNPSIWPDKSIYELLAFAQHYGYRTELLDWSYNPLVALYFAASGAICSYSYTKNYGSVHTNSLSIWVFDTEKKYLLNQKGQNNFEIIDVPRAANINVSSQQGCFTLIRQRFQRDEKLEFQDNRITNVRLLDDLMRENQQKQGLLKITTSHLEALKIFNFCNDYSINAATLFRGADGAARYANESIEISRFARGTGQKFSDGIPI